MKFIGVTALQAPAYFQVVLIYTADQRYENPRTIYGKLLGKYNEFVILANPSFFARVISWLFREMLPYPLFSLCRKPLPEI